MINAYDFDKTIYDGDSSVDFYLYCLKRNKKVLLSLPIQIYGLILYILGIIEKTEFKEYVFSYLKRIDDIDKYIKDFWKINYKKIKKWYLDQKEKSDVIISASPEFLLKSLEKKLNVKVIASKVNKKTGKFESKNCHDYEKIQRYQNETKNEYNIKKFYSDSIKSDYPMLEYAKEAYHVNKNEVKKIDIKQYTLKKDKKNLKKIIAILSIIALMASLVPILIASFYNHPAADDLTYTTYTMNAVKDGNIISLIKAIGDTIYLFYTTWQGTYSAIVLMSLQPAIWGEEMYFLGTFILIFTFLIANYKLLKEIIIEKLKSDKYEFIIIFSALTFICIQRLPNLTQGFFWWNGSCYYTLLFSFFLIELSLILKYYRKPKKINYFAICFLSLIVAGGNFVTALQQIIILTLINLYLLFNKKSKKFLPVLLISIVGLMISGLAPGNANRAVLLQGYGAIDAIIKSFIYAYNYIQTFSTNINILFIVIISLLLYPSLKTCRFKFKLPLLYSLLTICIFAAQFTPSLYAQGSEGDGRLINIIYYSYFWLMISNFYYYLGWFRNKLKENEILTTNSFEKFNYMIKHYMPTIIILLTIILGCNIVSEKEKFSIYQTYAILKDGSAKQYDIENKERLKIYNSKEKDILIKEFSVKPQPLFISDLSTDKDNWINNAVEQVYNKDSVTLIKNKE